MTTHPTEPADAGETIRQLRAQLATARHDALTEAVNACVRYRHHPDTSEEEAIGAMECALIISDLKGPTP